MKELPRFTGQQLMDHMRKDHGYTSWYSPPTNTKGYKLWKHQHEQDYHGRWADQQDHTHRDNLHSKIGGQAMRYTVVGGGCKHG